MNDIIKYAYVNNELIDNQDIICNVICVSGHELCSFFCDKGFLHRENGPAIETVKGDKYWYYNGLLHRLDGPAIECYDGNCYWYRYNLLGRNDGPAITILQPGQNYNYFWLEKGVLHREDGPAVEFSNGAKVWFNYGKFIKSEGLLSDQIIKRLTNIKQNKEIILPAPSAPENFTWWSVFYKIGWLVFLIMTVYVLFRIVL